MRRDQYRPLFRMTGQYPCLHSELFVKGPIGMSNALVIYKEGVWHSFMHNAKKKKCLHYGLDLFGSRERYSTYARTFRAFIAYAKRILLPKYGAVPETVTLQEFSELIKDTSNFFYLYGLTEFLFHDLVYQKLQESGDVILKKNLEDLGHLKFEGRELFTALLFKGGVLDNVLESISRSNNVDARLLFSEEIIRLLQGNPTGHHHVLHRQSCYALASHDGAIKNYSPQESLHLAEQFTSFHQESELKGTIACKGKVTGTVMIAPMLNDLRKVKEIVDQMKKGSILIAQSTTPDLLPLCNKAAAIVTDQGGMLSHAAVVSREMNIPCIIGTLEATRVFKTGDLVEVDAEIGKVRKL